MKKFLALMLVVVMMFALVSCGAKPSKFEKRLEKEDYDVEIIDDEDDLEEMADALIERYDLDVDGGLKWFIEAVGESYTDTVSIYCFEKKADATSVAKDLKKLVGGMVEVEQDGNLLFVGSEDAIEVAMGK
jgi:uncharacterized protein YpmS